MELCRVCSSISDKQPHHNYQFVTVCPQLHLRMIPVVTALTPSTRKVPPPGGREEAKPWSCLVLFILARFGHYFYSSTSSAARWFFCGGCVAGPPVTAAMVQILSSSSLHATGLVSFLAPLQRFCTLDTTSSWKLSRFCEGM